MTLETYMQAFWHVEIENLSFKYSFFFWMGSNLGCGSDLYNLYSTMTSCILKFGEEIKEHLRDHRPGTQSVRTQSFVKESPILH